MKRRWFCALLVTVLIFTMAAPAIAEVDMIDEIQSDQVEAPVSEQEVSLSDLEDLGVDEADAPDDDDTGDDAFDEGLPLGVWDADAPQMASDDALFASAPSPRNLISDTINANCTVNLNVGDTLTLKLNYPVQSYKSSKKKVAAVSGTGVVSALSKGTSKITITTVIKLKYVVTVNVYDPYQPTGISFKDGQSGSMYIGNTYTLPVTFSPSFAHSTLTWKSSKKKVVSVDQTGKLTALSAGTSVVTATTANKVRAAITITVLPNKVDNINGVPTASQIRSQSNKVVINLKSLEIDSKGNLICEMYLLNSLGNVKQLKSFHVQIVASGNGKKAAVAEYTFAKVSVSCSKYNYKLFKVTIPSAFVEKYNGGNIPLYVLSPSAYDCAWEATVRYTL